MKKIFTLLAMVLILAFTGCATTTNVINPPSDAVLQDLAVKISARHLGYMVGENNPARIDPMVELCAKFDIQGANTVGLFLDLLDQLGVQIAIYPLLKPDLEDLIEAMNFQVQADTILTDRQAFIINEAVHAFGEGLEIAKNPQAKVVPK